MCLLQLAVAAHSPKPHVLGDAAAVMHDRATGLTAMHIHCMQDRCSLTPTRQTLSHVCWLLLLLLLLVLLLLTKTSNSKPNFLKAHWRSSSDVPGAWPPNLQHTNSRNAGRTVICKNRMMRVLEAANLFLWCLRWSWSMEHELRSWSQAAFSNALNLVTRQQPLWLQAQANQATGELSRLSSTSLG
jgi:hypothetical protein